MNEGYKIQPQEEVSIKSKLEHVDPLLEMTINNPQLKELRAVKFKEIWEKEWQEESSKGNYFQTPEGESPFEDYSSKGWKIHIAFKKGSESEVARVLYENGLFFKIESVGTYFNGSKQSGSTIYVGSRDNTEKIAELIRSQLGEFLEEGSVAVFNDGEKISVGSGSDIEIFPKIQARFDVAKTEHGWYSGNGKYAEHGLPSWTGFGGIPVLKKFAKEVTDIERNWGNYTGGQRKVLLFKIYGDSMRELVKDFGQEFLFGSSEIIRKDYLAQNQYR